jgi:hypothetical protein
LPLSRLLKNSTKNLNRSSNVMRGLDPRIHLLVKKDGSSGHGFPPGNDDRFNLSGTALASRHIRVNG